MSRAASANLKKLSKEQFIEMRYGLILNVEHQQHLDELSGKIYIPDN
jgi:hypothetical protein